LTSVIFGCLGSAAVRASDFWPSSRFLVRALSGK